MPSPRHAQPSALRRVLDNRPRHVLSASVLAAALTVPFFAAAPSSAAPVLAPATPVTVPMDPVLNATQYARTNVNVRSGPSTSHSIVGSRSKGTQVTGTWQNGWLKIGSSQYISGTVLTSTPPGASTVTRYARTNVNVRSGPSTSHAIVGRESQGTKVTGSLTSSGWLNMGGEYISGAVLTTSPPDGDGGGDGSVTGADVLAEGAKYFGIMYHYGGNHPSTGVDCSGYTQYVYGRLGITLPRSAAAQQSFATPVSNPQPGDLVFWGYPAYHVGIYAGNGYIYDSGKPGIPVQKRKVFSGVSGYGRVL